MGFAYLALYTGDYLRDTRPLDTCEHGAYLLMLIYCWDQRGPLPLDEKKIAGICGARSPAQIKAVRRVLGEFFVKTANGYYNRRMQLEVERSLVLAVKRKAAGLKGLKALARAKAIAMHLPPTSTPSSTSLSTRSTPLAPSAAAPDAVRPVNGYEITIPLVGGAEFAVTHDMVREFDRLYPAVDVAQTLREIRGWNVANPTKRKTRSGILRHINSWLAREQNKD